MANHDPIQFATKRDKKINGKFTVFEFSTTLDHCYHRQMDIYFKSALFTPCPFKLDSNLRTLK